MKYTEEELEKALQENPSLARANSKPLVQPQKRRSVNPVKSQIQPAMTEKQFQEQIKKLAKIYGWLYYHTWRSFYSPQGYPDVTLVRPPRIILAELKAEMGQPTESQWVWLYTLQHCPGIECYLWKPSDWETIVEVLR